MYVCIMFMYKFMQSEKLLLAHVLISLVLSLSHNITLILASRCSIYINICTHFNRDEVDCKYLLVNLISSEQNDKMYFW